MQALFLFFSKYFFERYFGVFITDIAADIRADIWTNILQISPGHSPGLNHRYYRLRVPSLYKIKQTDLVAFRDTCQYTETAEVICYRLPDMRPLLKVIL